MDKDELKKLAKVDVKKVLTFINNRTQNNPCPICKTGEMTLLHDPDSNSLAIQYSLLTTVDDDSKAIRFESANYVLICSNCGAEHKINSNFVIGKLDN
jgi:hypothetical protein